MCRLVFLLIVVYVFEKQFCHTTLPAFRAVLQNIRNRAMRIVLQKHNFVTQVWETMDVRVTLCFWCLFCRVQFQNPMAAVDIDVIKSVCHLGVATG